MKNISTFKEHIKRKVLIVEDEAVNQMILGNIISSKYDPVYANNGQEALDILLLEHDISLIMLDIIMPVMDGFEFLDKFMKNERINHVPIIVLTGDRSAEIKAINMGAQDFIAKPYDSPEIILARAERTISLFEEKEIIRVTARDSLTGLFTKTYFFEFSLEYESFNPDNAMDALVIDIKRFHSVNEIYGHDVGDQILITISHYLQSLFEKYEGIVSRVEEDIFFLYISHQEEYETLMKSLTQIIRKEINDDIDVEFKFGVFPNCNGDSSPEIRFRKAQRMCNLLRNDFTNNIKYYDEEVMQKELFNEKLLYQIDKAIEDKQFKIYLQPKFDISGDEPKLVSAEALVRWIHPEYGMISPGIFVPLFEHNGLTPKLDRYIWNETASIIHKWKEKGRYVPVSVNVSRINFFLFNFEQILLDVVRENEISIKDLYLEITESAYTDNDQLLSEVITNLSHDGFIIEMDDFGTGYSSLNMLANFPFDILKIDMSFIRNITKSVKDLKIVELILEIAKFLNLKTVAEGVETKEQCDLLKSLGCNIIQGYYFSKPIPHEEFEEKYLKEKK